MENFKVKLIIDILKVIEDRFLIVRNRENEKDNLCIVYGSKISELLGFI